MQEDTVKQIAKAVIFAILLALMICLLSNLFTPNKLTKREDCIHKIYEQPKDTAQVLCVGASTVLTGISSDYLYEHFGMSVFNAASSQQPTFTSLYVLKELLANQKNTDLVIVDVSPLVGLEDEQTLANRAMADYSDMRFSPNKFEFLFDADKRYEKVGIKRELELIPILKYHSRWNELTDADYGHVGFDDGGNYAHGQLIWRRSYQSNITQKRAGEFTDERNVEITDSRDFPDEKLREAWNKTNIDALDMLIELCQANSIDVLFLRTPTSEWGDLQHDSIMLLAETYNVPFLDLSMPNLFATCGLDYDADFYDGKHCNILGSEKVSQYLGEYLANSYSLTDLRNDPSLSYMEEDLKTYHSMVNDAQLMTCTNIDEYLDLIDNDEYTVFVSVKGDAAAALDESTRAKLADLGFKKLAKINEGESYVGIRDAGRVGREVIAADGDGVSLEGQYRDGKVVLRELNLQANAFLTDAFSLTSSSSKSEITINGGKRSENYRGINFAVYNSRRGLLLDTSSFGTHKGPDRTSDLPPSETADKA